MDLGGSSTVQEGEKVIIIGKEPYTRKPDHSKQIQNMESLNVKEVKKKEDRETSIPEESEKTWNAARRVSALDTIMKAIEHIKPFTSEFKEEKSYIQGYLSALRELSHRTNPLEENDKSRFLRTVLDILPRHNSNFKLSEVSTKNCRRCRKDTEYQTECSYGTNIKANLLRDIKYEFEEFNFEKILKTVRIKLKMECETEGCGKRNYVQPRITELPSIFTIGLDWKNNETKEEIYDTISVLSTEMDIAQIYKYDGNSTSTKYHLVSMVCSCEDEYTCLAYKNNRWVKYLLSDERKERKVIGDWNQLLWICREEDIRPEVLFFENVMKRDPIPVPISEVDRTLPVQNPTLDRFTGSIESRESSWDPDLYSPNTRVILAMIAVLAATVALTIGLNPPTTPKHQGLRFIFRGSLWIAALSSLAVLHILAVGVPTSSAMQNSNFRWAIVLLYIAVGILLIAFCISTCCM